MTSKKHLWLAVAILVFASAGHASAGPNANAVVSLDLIADGGAGNRTDDGITSGVVSGQGTTIAVEIFATGVRTSLLGMVIEFDLDVSLLSFVKAEQQRVLPDGSGRVDRHSVRGAQPRHVGVVRLFGASGV